MAAIPVTDPVVTSQSGTMAQVETQGQHYDGDGNGENGAGKHGTGVFNDPTYGDKGLSTDLTRELVPGLIKDEYDDAVVKMGYSSTPMNAMMREMGSKPIKSLVFGYYSIDLRKTEDVLQVAVSAIAADEAARKVPKPVEITVGDDSVFDVSDVILFDGVSGYDENGVETPYINLAALVVSKPGSNKLNIQFLNAKTIVSNAIPATTKIYILGHAAAEEDASTTPWMALPEPTQQYMQKFMVQSLISSVFEESNKEVNWTKKDVDDIILQQLVEDIENFYIFGVRSYTFNPNTKLHTRTCAGVLQQMFEGGAPVIELYEDDMTFAGLLQATRLTFEGNSGSMKRYMFSGGKIAPAIWGIKDLYKTATVKDFRAFGYDFEGLNLMGYSLVHVPHPLLNKKGKSNYAIVIDRAYLQRGVFRSMKDTKLELEKTGSYDGDSTVWSEISAPILKYPKAHALWILKEGSAPAGDSSSESAA